MREDNSAIAGINLGMWRGWECAAGKRKFQQIPNFFFQRFSGIWDKSWRNGKQGMIFFCGILGRNSQGIQGSSVPGNVQGQTQEGSGCSWNSFPTPKILGISAPSHPLNLEELDQNLGEKNGIWECLDSGWICHFGWDIFQESWLIFLHFSLYFFFPRDDFQSNGILREFIPKIPKPFPDFSPGAGKILFPTAETKRKLDRYNS